MTDLEGRDPARLESSDKQHLRAARPLVDLLVRIDRAVAGLAAGSDEREALHALRSGLSDICALTEPDPRILRAVNRLVNAGDRLAEATIPPLQVPRRNLKPARLNAARQALAKLTVALTDARPSRIAKSLGRDW